ncbi:hypothetical protein ACFRK5_04085 [Streptomyces niveus]|uniref:hypothetical protein n=1 Tax=Streptomyces niveus TaxID=193462 RepID=UPI0036B7A6C1
MRPVRGLPLGDGRELLGADETADLQLTAPMGTRFADIVAARSWGSCASFGQETGLR